jgi:hypothetical protein
MKGSTRARPLSSQRATLKMLKEFRGVYSTVSVAPDGTVSATFAPNEPEKAKPKTAPPARLTAIEALSRKAPDFDFEMPEETQ